MSLSNVPNILKLIFVRTRFIEEREERLQRNYEEEPIREYFTDGNIDAIHCHKIPIREVISGLRDFNFSVGFTQITICFGDTLINDDEWEIIRELLKEKSIDVENFGPDYQSGGSYITVATNGFNARKLENVVSTTRDAIHDGKKIAGVENVLDR